ncbi:MAG: aminotransferase class V-fold PLP-dependent enzyme, partial [Bacteroidia bacterium]
MIARFFGALEEEICLTHNVTDGINIVAQGLPLKEGDEIIISNQEHVGNALPWLARAQRDKLVIRVLDLTLP